MVVVFACRKVLEWFFGVFVVLKNRIGSVPLSLAHMVQDKYVNPLFNLPLLSKHILRSQLGDKLQRLEPYLQ